MSSVKLSRQFKRRVNLSIQLTPLPRETRCATKLPSGQHESIGVGSAKRAMVAGKQGLNRAKSTRKWGRTWAVQLTASAAKDHCPLTVAACLLLNLPRTIVNEDQSDSECRMRPTKCRLYWAIWPCIHCSNAALALFLHLRLQLLLANSNIFKANYFILRLA